MSAILFPCRQWSFAEARLLWVEGGPKNPDLQPDNTENGPDKKVKKLDGKDLKSGGVDKAADAAKKAARELVEKTVKSLNADMQKDYNTVMKEGKLKPEDASKQIADKWQALVDGMKPKPEGIKITAKTDGAPEASAAAPETDFNTIDDNLDGTNLGKIKKDIKDSVAKLKNSKDAWEALGHLATIVAKGAEAISLGVSGQLLKESPEKKEEKAKRSALMTEIPKDAPGDLKTKLTTLRTQKADGKTKEEATLKTNQSTLDTLTKEKTEAKLGDKPKLEKKSKDAETLEATTQKTINDSKQNIEKFDADIKTIDKMVEDLTKMTERINSMVEAAGYDGLDGFSKAFGKFTITPDGLVPIDGKLKAWFPNATEQKPVTFADIKKKQAEFPSTAKPKPSEPLPPKS